MPQLDFSTFAPQIVWLVITFVALYFLMSKVALPRISVVLENRRDRIANDLDEAQRLRAETENVIQVYEAELAEARAKAHGIAAETREKLNAEIAVEQAKIDEKIDARMAEAEAKITAMKDQAMGEVNAAAADTADAIIRSLVGGRPAKAEIARAVAAARGQ
jgi:F-type H+-transporting ATPase subunit b